MKRGVTCGTIGSVQTGADDEIDPARVVELLGVDVPRDSEAWSSAVESLEQAALADRLFDQAERLERGPARNAVLQEAHDAMRLAADWELDAREQAATAV
ncbi:hypothetical protein [Angustibacter aerolatus]